MALPRRKDVTAKAFNNSPELQFALTDVTPVGELLGSDSFGSVEKVCPHQLKLSCKTCTQDVQESCSNLALMHGKYPFSCPNLGHGMHEAKEY